ncbi:MAG: hypothetical protein KY468_16265 [Armatimonadetes bacterium]|nr:hypothetical protein [Armatimonadota bacterium]
MSLPACKNAEDVHLAIALLTERHRKDLFYTRFVCTYTDRELKDRGRTVIVKSKIRRNEDAYYLQQERSEEDRRDEIVELLINEKLWGRLPERKREAELFHQLCYFQYASTGKLQKVNPDFIGFYEEVALYGLWRSDLKRYAEIIQPQMTFADAAEEVERQTAVGMEMIHRIHEAATRESGVSP